VPSWEEKEKRLVPLLSLIGRDIEKKKWNGRTTAKLPLSSCRQKVQKKGREQQKGKGDIPFCPLRRDREGGGKGRGR